MMCFTLTNACFSFVVLNEEADGDCLQHDEQRLTPSTKSQIDKIWLGKRWKKDSPRVCIVKPFWTSKTKTVFCLDCSYLKTKTEANLKGNLLTMLYAVVPEMASSSSSTALKLRPSALLAPTIFRIWGSFTSKKKKKKKTSIVYSSSISQPNCQTFHFWAHFHHLYLLFICTIVRICNSVWMDIFLFVVDSQSSQTILSKN